MHTYIITFIDGHSLQYKVTTIKAETKQEAVMEFFTTWEDFDHDIISIKEDGKLILER